MIPDMPQLRPVDFKMSVDAAAVKVFLVLDYPGNYQRQADIPGNGMFRTEVRVFWPREGRTVTPGYCSTTTNANSFTVDDTDEFHFVHMVSAVRQSTS